jgi:hypothetical protein
LLIINKQEKEKIMRSVAQEYIEKGEYEEIILGREEGI